MLPKRLSLLATAGRGWLAGPLLLVALVSPPVEVLSEQRLVIHHFVHWLMVLGGALLGYQFRNLVRLPMPPVVAAAGLGAALAWHLPPLLAWAEAHVAAHALAHVTLIAGGSALGWAVPKLSDPVKAYFFIAANVVMWPLVMAELLGAFTYAHYPGQATAAGLAELAAMTSSWLVLAIWTPLRSFFASPIPLLAADVLLATAAVAGWVFKPVIG